MVSPRYTTSEGAPGAGFALMARIVDLAGDDIVQADISSISYEVWPKANPRLVQTGTLTIASVIFDTLQTDSGWNTERWPDGFNFRSEFAGSLLPKENEVYRFYIRLIPASGNEGEPLIHDRRTFGKNDN